MVKENNKQIRIIIKNLKKNVIIYFKSNRTQRITKLAIIKKTTGQNLNRIDLIDHRYLDQKEGRAKEVIKKALINLIEINHHTDKKDKINILTVIETNNIILIEDREVQNFKEDKGSRDHREDKENRETNGDKRVKETKEDKEVREDKKNNLMIITT